MTTLFGAGDSPARLDRDPRFTRLRRGWYAHRDEVDGSERWDRYLTAVHAVGAARPGAVFARESALALAGLPFGTPTDVFTIDDPNMPGVLAGVRNSHVAVPSDDVIVEHGLARCSPAYALAHVARMGTQVDAVSALDWALRTRMVELESVEAALHRQGPRGRRRARWVLGFADERAESVGESWSRVLMHRMGAPPPVLQPAVPTSLGLRFPDFWWERPGRRPLVGEFDGESKYGVLAHANGQQPLDAVIAEKRREDAMRERHDVARWMWDSLLQPARLVAILERAHLPVRRSLLPGW